MAADGREENSPTRTRRAGERGCNKAVPSLGHRPLRPCLATLLGKRRHSIARQIPDAIAALMIDRVIPPSVQPWARCDPRRLRDLGGVLTDIDDTLTTEGAIPMGVVAALSALRVAGLPVVAVTGRPMGWSSRSLPRCRWRRWSPKNGAVAPDSPTAPAGCGPNTPTASRCARPTRSAWPRRRRASSARCRAPPCRATASAGSPTSPSTTPSSPVSTRHISPRWWR